MGERANTMFDDIDYNAVFGVETEAENASGAEEQETAEPAEEEDTEGAEEQDVAEPADDSGESPDDTGAEEQDSSGAKKPKGKKDSVYAAARRRAEAEKNREIDEIIKGMGWTDPYTQQPISSKADYDAYKSKFQEDQRKKIAEKSGMTDDEFNEYIAELPEVKEAREAKEQAQQAQIQAQISEELRQISALDPSVHTVNDVLTGENADQVKAYIGRGMTMLEAFKLANYERLRSVSAEDERRHAAENAASKSHLTQSRSRGQGMSAVPKETMQYYKMYFPNMTDAEIQRDYNKYLKNNGG